MLCFFSAFCLFAIAKADPIRVGFTVPDGPYILRGLPLQLEPMFDIRPMYTEPASSQKDPWPQ
jgi:hypothetical protein